MTPQGYYRKKDIQKLTQLSDSTIRRLELDKKFPARIKISSIIVAWKIYQVERWLEDPCGWTND